MLLGVILIIIGLALILGYFLGGQKSKVWRNLGYVTTALGVLIVAVGTFLYFRT